ncbi:MAG: zinc metalloprotease HtpX [Methanomicrobia archaeon]|nr:zinc metalloprotease HtpX [Methanomicrobia archaeon]MCK4637348.1 zinc metalloprotease HtpX [Methanomicrobia archaeon]
MSLKTGALMIFLTLILVAAGGIIGMIFGYPIETLSLAFIIAILINLISYWYSDKIVLSMYRAKLVTQNEYPKLYTIVSRVAMNAGVPMPRIAYIPNNVPNAFATGRNENNAVVAVTKGALDILSEDELEAVIAHEIGHIKNKDMRIQTIAAVIAAIIGYLGFMGRFMIFSGRRERGNAQIIGIVLLAVFLPLAALIIRMAISRTREYGADERSAQFTGMPDQLARALIKIQNSVKRKPMRKENPAIAHMFIVNPFRGESLVHLFSTHPPMRKRIEKLNELAVEMGRPQVSI